MLAACKRGNYGLAVAEMLASRWARRIAPRAEKGPRQCPDSPGRGLACLTAHEPSSIMHLDKKGRLKSLFPGRGDDRQAGWIKGNFVVLKDLHS